MDLLQRMERGREEWIVVEGHEFQVRRPTAVKIMEDALRARPMREVLLEVLVGWKLKEHELVPGGGGDVPPFDARACVSWLEDRPSLYGEVVGKVNGIAQAYMEQLGLLEKK
jgi:hypothetical protein